MLRDYHDFIMNLRSKGYNYRQISEALESEYGYKVSRQAITKYINRQEVHKLEITDLILPQDLEEVFISTSARKAHQYLLEQGYDIKYHKVLSIRNQNKSSN